MKRASIHHTLVFAAAAAAVLVAPIPAAGQGQTVEIGGELTIHDHPFPFHGRLDADNKACVDQRKVKIFIRKPSGRRELIGYDLAFRNGDWSLLIDPIRRGDYFAVARRSEEGAAGTTYVCARLKSKTISVD